MVTRTIKTTKVNVLCLNIADAEPFNQCVELARTYKDEKAMMKAVSAIIDSDEVKAVHIVDSEVCEKLYGMTEQNFITNATELNKR